jgi:hypothetical protein
LRPVAIQLPSIDPPGPLAKRRSAADVVNLDTMFATFAIRALGDHRDAITHDAGDRSGGRAH